MEAPPGFRGDMPFTVDHDDIPTEVIHVKVLPVGTRLYSVTAEKTSSVYGSSQRFYTCALHVATAHVTTENFPEYVCTVYTVLKAPLVLKTCVGSPAVAVGEDPAQVKFNMDNDSIQLCVDDADYAFDGTFHISDSDWCGNFIVLRLKVIDEKLTLCSGPNSCVCMIEARKTFIDSPFTFYSRKLKEYQSHPSQSIRHPECDVSLPSGMRRVVCELPGRPHPEVMMRLMWEFQAANQPHGVSACLYALGNADCNVQYIANKPIPKLFTLVTRYLAEHAPHIDVDDYRCLDERPVKRQRVAPKESLHTDVCGILFTTDHSPWFPKETMYIPELMASPSTHVKFPCT